MTTEDKTNPPDGMSEASAKFEHEAKAPAKLELGHYPRAWNRFGGSIETAVDRHHVSRIELLRNRERPAPFVRDRAL